MTVLLMLKKLLKLFGINKVNPVKKIIFEFLFYVAPKRPTVIPTKEGFKLMVVPRDRGVGFPLWIGHEYEPQTSKIFKNFISSGDIVMDIGANIGYFTLLAARLVGQYGKVLAFEPVPYFLELICSSARLNNLTNITAFQMALSDTPGEGHIFLDKKNLGLASPVSNNVIDLSESLQVKYTTIDIFCEENGIKPNFVKIDVQGYELKVLRGAIKLLQRGNAKLYFEFWPRGINNAGDMPEEIFYLLEATGYKVFKVNNDGGFSPVSKNEFLKITMDLLSESNYLSSVNIFATK